MRAEKAYHMVEGVAVMESLPACLRGRRAHHGGHMFAMEEELSDITLE